MIHTMGFYIRKSVSVGPFRLNLSKSGLGLSVGVKGFRVGVGPAGQYIHMGREGIYYRKTFSSSPKINLDATSRNSFQAPSPPIVTEWSLGPMSEYRSVDSLELADSDSKELIDELNRRKNLTSLFPLAMVGALIFFAALLLMPLPLWLPAILFFPSAFGMYWVRQRDEVRKTTAFFYSLDSAVGPVFEQLCSSFEDFSRCGRVWRLDGAANVLDRKYHAGAGSIVKRTKISPSFQDPPGVRSNISVPALPLAENTLYLFPDRVLVLGRSGWGAISWEQLVASAFITRFIEGESVPHDAQIVDHTWQYVNKSGGPDRRFSNNRQIPICSYGLLTLETDSGLSESIHVSKSNVAIDLSNALFGMTESFQTEEQKKGEYSPSEQWQKGVACENGDGVPQDLNEAIYWYQLAAEAGFANAQNSLGVMYQNGLGVEKDSNEAVRFYKLAAAQGHENAQLNLGILYHLGDGIPQDFAEANRLFRLASDQGNAHAQHNLGASFLNGERTEKKCREAARLLGLSAQQGRDDSQVGLGEIYFVGLPGVPQDLPESLRLFSLAAEQGNPRAQFSLGYMSEQGIGVPKDEEKAVFYYQQSANHGYNSAQTNLALMHKEGRTVRKNLVEAFRLFTLAANSGEPEAQFELGNAYEFGEGSAKDEAQAAYWYGLAAKQGRVDAQTRLMELGLT